MRENFRENLNGPAAKKLRRLAGVSEPPSEREPAAEILSPKKRAKDLWEPRPFREKLNGPAAKKR